MPASVDLKGQPITMDQWQEFVAGFCPPAEDEPGRRSGHRHRLRGTVRVKYTQNGAPHLADLDVLNISSSGITARHWLAIAPETDIDMQLMLDEVTLRVRGKVVHCTSAPGGHRVGIQFEF